jgi:hypothetical protein
MKLVPLRSQDRVVLAHAIVDDDDFGWLSQWSWSFAGGGYAGRRTTGGIMLMHRQILGLDFGDPLQGDHRDRVKLNNQRSNLRVATRAEQQQNLPSMGGTSRFRGVSFCSQTGRWRAAVTFEGRQWSCGRHNSEIEAALGSRSIQARTHAFRRTRL